MNGDDASYLQQTAWETSEKCRQKMQAWFVKGNTY